MALATPAANHRSGIQALVMLLLVGSAASSRRPLRLGRASLVFLGQLFQSPLGLRVVDGGEKKPANARYLHPQKPSVIGHSG
jgi:hypothetical protein